MEYTEYKDMVLTCQDCGARFLFSAGEQRFYAKKGFKHIPKRCPACRARRRWERLNRHWHTVICEACGTETKVPFLPKGIRPVYCYECFRRLQGKAT
ncbi:MAG TPA: zinc-binding protein [Chloroflexi bacterium]|nr:zinc-binding protein [Chloroflexota bacterium]